MTSRPPPLSKTEEEYREEILDRVEEGWLEEDWTRTMPHLLNELLQKNFTSARKPTSTRVSHATERVQWIRIEELGKALTNRCRAVRELSSKKQEISQGSEIETLIVNSLNLNANLEHLHEVASMNFSI